MSTAKKIVRRDVDEIPFQEASLEIWSRKYRLTTKDGEPVDATMDDTWHRVAVALAAVEDERVREHWSERFCWALQNGAIPAGRILSNAGGLEHKPATSTINCTVSGTIGDSMDDILNKVHEAGLTLKAGCGIGYEFSTLRPRGAYVSGAGAYTSGPMSFMDIYDRMCFTVSSAGGRRGAQMGTFDIGHPDAMDFIRAKRENGRLRQFNLSLLVTDEFIAAVRAGGDWQLAFPLTEREYDAAQHDLADPGAFVWREWPEPASGWRSSACAGTRPGLKGLCPTIRPRIPSRRTAGTAAAAASATVPAPPEIKPGKSGAAGAGPAEVPKNSLGLLAQIHLGPLGNRRGPLPWYASIDADFRRMTNMRISALLAVAALAVTASADQLQRLTLEARGALGAGFGTAAGIEALPKGRRAPHRRRLPSPQAPYGAPHQDPYYRCNRPLVHVDNSGYIYKDGNRLGSSARDFKTSCNGLVAWRDSSNNVYKESDRLGWNAQSYDIAWNTGDVMWKNSSGDIHKNSDRLGWSSQREQINHWTGTVVWVNSSGAIHKDSNQLGWSSQEFAQALFTGDVVWKNSSGYLYKNDRQLGSGARSFKISDYTGTVAWLDNSGYIYRDDDRLGSGVSRYEQAAYSGDVVWLDNSRYLYKNSDRIGSGVREFRMEPDGRILWVADSARPHFVQ